MKKLGGGGEGGGESGTVLTENLSANPLFEQAKLLN
jgi:hypothetical protein